jgi:hypothetical protein
MSMLFSIRNGLVEIGKTCTDKRFLTDFARLALSLILVQTLTFVRGGVCLADDQVPPQNARDKQEFERSRKMIRAERQAAVDQVSAQTAVGVNRIYGDVARRVADLHARNQERLEQMRNAWVYRSDGRYVRPVKLYSQEQIDKFAEDFIEQEQAYLHEESPQNQLRAAGEHQKNELEVGAENLESQLEVDQSRHGFKLSPVGTNLYVRNYQLGGGSADDEDDMPATGLRAPAAKTFSNGQAPMAARAVPGRLSAARPLGGISSTAAGKSGTMVKTTVTGKYLKQ